MFCYNYNLQRHLNGKNSCAKYNLDRLDKEIKLAELKITLMKLEKGYNIHNGNNINNIHNGNNNTINNIHNGDNNLHIHI